MQSAVLGVNLLYHFDALNILMAAETYLSALPTEHIEALAYHNLTLHAQGYVLGLVFFGVHCIFLGVLIWRSQFAPKLIGVLMIVAALAYLADAFATFVMPQYKPFIAEAMILPAVIGEFSFTLWLFWFGFFRKSRHKDLKPAS